MQHIAAGEEECTTLGYRRLLEQGNINIVQIDLTRTGLTRALEIVAHAHGLRRKICSRNFTMDINTLISLYFPCTNALVLEHSVEPSELSSSLACNHARIRDGFGHLPQEPGLGVESDESVVEKYLV